LIPLYRVPVAQALAWIDAATAPLPPEELPLGDAANRALAADVHAPKPVPPADGAAIDGYALRAEASLGAGGYNPLVVAAVAIGAGVALPAGADAVVPLDQAELAEDGGVMLIEPVAAGTGVEPAGTIAAAGDRLSAGGTVLAARHIGLLAAAGWARVAVIRQPCVRLAVAAAPRSDPAIDGNGPMLKALIERDGGIVRPAPFGEAFAAGCDLVLVSGGTAPGPGVRSAAALAAGGSLEIHGVALNPGESAGFGHTADGIPAVLLPGTPAACLWSYELLAGRAVRRLAGRDPRLPYGSRLVTTARKIVSAIGMIEIFPVRLVAEGAIEPLASFAEAGLMPAAEGDGFVVVPAASEGYPAGSQLRAYFYDEARNRAEIAP
jgi:molybdopterin molybdotransferase